jgi:hypothetical protein
MDKGPNGIDSGAALHVYARVCVHGDSPILDRQYPQEGLHIAAVDTAAKNDFDSVHRLLNQLPQSHNAVRGRARSSPGHAAGQNTVYAGVD